MILLGLPPIFVGSGGYFWAVHDPVGTAACLFGSGGYLGCA
jgi:hypothetical protein